MYLRSSPSRTTRPCSTRAQRSLRPGPARPGGGGHRAPPGGAPRARTHAAPAEAVRRERLNGLRADAFSGSRRETLAVPPVGCEEGRTERDGPSCPLQQHARLCGSGCILYRREQQLERMSLVLPAKVLGKTICVLSLLHIRFPFPVLFKSSFYHQGELWNPMSTFMCCVLFLGTADSRGS